MESFYKGKYGHLGTKGRMTDIPSGGMVTPAHQGYRAPYRATPRMSNVPGGGVTRMGRYDMSMPRNLGGRFKTPSSSNQDASGWAQAMARAAMNALKQSLMALNQPLSVDAPQGWWANDSYAGYTKQALECAEDLTQCVGAVGCLQRYQRVSADVTTCVGCNGTLSSNICYSSFMECYNANPGATRIAQWHRKSITTGRVWKWWKRNTGPSVGKQIFLKGLLQPLNNPWPDPFQHPYPGPVGAPAIKGRTDEDGRLRDRPYVRPSTDIVFVPGKPRPPVVKTGEHKDVPDKSKKVRGVPKAMVAAIALMHGLTELKDFVDALYEALPPIARCAGKRGLVHDLICVLEHADAFGDPDVMADAIANLIANEVEDRVIGALFGSNWRTGVRNFNDQYGGSAWIGGGYGAPTADAGFGGLISWSGSARMSPM